MTGLFTAYTDRLKKYPSFSSGASLEPLFTYSDSSAPELIRLRGEFHPEPVTGTGDTFTRTLALMERVHRDLFFVGGRAEPAALNTAEIMKVSKKGELFCTHYAVVLTELLLSIGIKARLVSCIPEIFDCDSHTGVLVYLPETSCWFFADPTFNTYFEENGKPLDIFDIRKLYAEDRPPKFRHITIDKQWELSCGGVSCETYDEWYRLYMAKNSFRFMSPAHSRYGCLSEKDAEWVAVNPTGFNLQNEYDQLKNIIYTKSSAEFLPQA